MWPLSGSDVRTCAATYTLVQEEVVHQVVGSGFDGADVILRPFGVCLITGVVRPCGCDIAWGVPRASHAANKGKGGGNDASERRHLSPDARLCGSHVCGWVGGGHARDLVHCLSFRLLL